MDTWLRISRRQVALVILTAIIATMCFIAAGCLLVLNGSLREARAPATPTGPKRVLVTGAAGFIGFHVASKLALDPDNYVVGMDNFNDRYDVQLKIDRAYQLHQRGVTIHHADLCDVTFLQYLFQKGNFSHVVHLGAQAGVRYSLENPVLYVHSNLEGTQAILDILKQYPGIRLTYASSSSVYGKENTIPFRLTANTDHPGNMYAATKRANELMAYQQCTATGLRNVGLRFFTVYGPWGRPDMAMFKFAQSILDKKKVPSFKVTGDTELARDFTYVDDITDGLLSAMNQDPKQCGVVYNLGYGQHVSVHRLINLLEQELGEQAELADLPLPPTEILQTWADIDVSRHMLAFNPQTNLEQGVKHFVSWYKDYRLSRQEQEKSGVISPSRIWYDSLHKHSMTETS